MNNRKKIKYENLIFVHGIQFPVESKFYLTLIIFLTCLANTKLDDKVHNYNNIQPKAFIMQQIKYNKFTI